MKKINNKIKRKLRNRKKLKNVNTDRYRNICFKVFKIIYSAQIIDDKAKKNIGISIIN
jgi:ribosomal protein L18